MHRAERLGLGVSAAGHVLLFGALSLGFLATRPLVLNSPPMEVDLVSEVSLKSAAQRVSQVPPPPATAPEVAPAEEPPPLPEPPKPVEHAPPPPKPIPAAKPVPKAAPKPPTPTQPKPARPTPTKPTAKAGTRATALALSDDIVKGAASERTPKAAPAPTAAVPAATVGPAQQRALDAEIRRKIKPNWVGRAPTGADAEQLVTVVTFQLSLDGNLIGDPKGVTTGINDSNRAQASVHKETAIKAVRLSAPFALPPELYDYWKILEIRFDKRLSQ